MKNRTATAIDIALLKKTVQDGFSNAEKHFQTVEGHLSTLNGKVAEHEKRLNLIDGEKRGIRISWEILVGLLGASGLVWGIIFLVKLFLPH